MFRRERHINIPIEILRTVITIVDCGSFTKAGERLGLSQPGISAQIKKLQLLVGGPVFERTSNGVMLTEKGKMLLPLTQRLLESNDQILCLGGVPKDPRPIRLGITDFYAEAFLKALPRDRHGGLHIHCDQAQEIAKGIHDGYFDVGCLLDPPKEIGHLAETWQEDLVWVRSRDFVSSPGNPVPVICWPGFSHDRIGLEALQMQGVPYRISFESRDHQTRKAAVGAGIGIMVLPSRAVDAPLVVAREYYLPALPSLEAGVSLRPDVDMHRANEIRSILTSFVHKRLHELV